MLLKSSSNPVLQTLFFSDSPNRDFDTNHHHCYPHPHDHCSIHGGHRRYFSLSSFSCNSSPISHSASGSSEFNKKNKNSVRHKAFRRARSEGNLEGLASTSFDLNRLTRSFHKHSKSMLHTSPSFSIYTAKDGIGEENEKEELEVEKLVKSDEGLERSVTIGESIEAMGSGEFSFGKKSMALIDENDEEEVLNEFQNVGIEEEVELPASPLMYLATGLGIDGNSIGGVGGGGGGDFTLASIDEGGDVEEYYKRMVGEDPSNPLFLRNYAQLLESKGDLHGAEEYYFRATLADPKDGEILLLYAKLVWELHHDQDRALNYFERAARAAPEDSHVLAAYACFLWEIEVDKEEDFAGNDHNQIEGDKCVLGLQNSAFEEGKEPVSATLCLAAGQGIHVAGVGGSIGSVDSITADAGEGGNIEEYYKRMVEENPSNPLFLRNYAQFLYQSKGDLKEAEEYYSRAVLADPGDGEIISQYAKLVWELHHDHGKASSYFELAVQAAPEDSHVLAAYANFLWETEEDDEEDSAGHDVQAPLFIGAMASSSA